MESKTVVYLGRNLGRTKIFLDNCILQLNTDSVFMAGCSEQMAGYFSVRFKKMGVEVKYEPVFMQPNMKVIFCLQSIEGELLGFEQPEKKIKGYKFIKIQVDGEYYRDNNKWLY